MRHGNRIGAVLGALAVVGMAVVAGCRMGDAPTASKAQDRAVSEGGGTQRASGQRSGPGDPVTSSQAEAARDARARRFHDLKDLSQFAESELAEKRPHTELTVPDSDLFNTLPEDRDRPAEAQEGARDRALRTALAGPADELWVIAEHPDRAAIPRDDDTPGSGALVARVEGQEEPVPVPLEHTDVRGEVSGYIATIDVTQQFHNPFDKKIEAVYVFPLPHDAAVHDFLMKIGERTIRGIIREREKAERIYKEARRAGHNAALLTQERPNVFTQKVANIEPGKGIDIEIRYVHALAYRSGYYEFVFPMVVGPRFNPPGWKDGVAALPRGSQGTSGQATEVTHLGPGERSGHDIALEVEVDAGVEIEDIRSLNHAVSTETHSESRRTVRLSPNDAIPNKDFVLRYEVAGDRLKANLLTHVDEGDGYFTLMVYPPAGLENLERRPVEMIFVLDCSGSMSGQPIAKAKRAARDALARLGPQDSFQIIRFSQSASRLGSRPLPATPENIERGLDYLEDLSSGGGTHMLEGIRAALDFPHDPERLRLVSFMTDGFIGNEVQVFREIYDELGDARIFSFGVGSSVNRHLLEGMARLGRGAVAYVGLDDDVVELVDEFYEAVQHPALTDLEIDWGGLEVTDVFPKRLPDLFVGRPLLLTGRFAAGRYGETTVRVTGRAGSREAEIEIDVDLDGATRHPGIASVWARKQIQVLSDHAANAPGDELPDEIRRIALAHNLVSSHTAFVAVDGSTTTEGSYGVRVPVPVPVPDGVRYETTVGK